MGLSLIVGLLRPPITDAVKRLGPSKEIPRGSNNVGRTRLGDPLSGASAPGFRRVKVSDRRPGQDLRPIRLNSAHSGSPKRIDRNTT